MHGGDGVLGEWISDIKIGIGIECGRERGRGAIVSASTAVGADEDVREGVGLPLETEVTIPSIVTREAP